MEYSKSWGLEMGEGPLKFLVEYFFSLRFGVGTMKFPTVAPWKKPFGHLWKKNVRLYMARQGIVLKR